MTLSNGNISRVTGHCAGNSSDTSEFPTQRPVPRSCDVFFDLPLNKRLSKQSWGWWFETPWYPLWRHCNWVNVCPAVKSLEDVLLELEQDEFLEYIQQAGLIDELRGEASGNFTVFVPSLEAFQSKGTCHVRSGGGVNGLSSVQCKSCRADSRFAPSQWETSLQSNAVPHWLGAKLGTSLNGCVLPIL